MFNEKDNSMETTHDHQEIFASEWAKSQDNFFITRLRAGASLAEIIQERPDFVAAFKSEGEALNVLECSDGRVNGNAVVSADEKLGLAGEGILLSADQLQNFVAQQQGQIKEVASHDECGAAALKFKDWLASGQALPEGVTNGDELGIYFAKHLAEQLGVPYRHIQKSDFSCAVHNERALVLDGTARFNAHKFKDFPPRFMSAALGLGQDMNYVKQEAEILSGIALGDHGFGARFTAENPFYIVVIASDEAQLSAVEESLKPFEEKMAGRVKIQALLAPEK